MATNFSQTTDHHDHITPNIHVHGVINPTNNNQWDLVPDHYSSTFSTSPFFEFPNHDNHGLLETIFKTSTTQSEDQSAVQPPPPPQSLSRTDEEDDGYNWRKYGQKQMKGSENPRSYYKCVVHNCPTKKKVERDLNQRHIIEIVYTGTHNHPMPRSPKSNRPTNNIKQEPDISTSSSTFFDQTIHHSKYELDHHPMLASHGAGVLEREPKVVIQTTSIIDVLEDGYKWRKYGQKSVKGNLNPRSYYKCANKGCSVRKQVERATEDLRDVITTYEGKHNHDIPISSHRRRSDLGVFGWSGNGNDNNNSMPIRPIATARNLNNNSSNPFQDTILSSILVKDTRKKKDSHGFSSFGSFTQGPFSSFNGP